MFALATVLAAPLGTGCLDLNGPDLPDITLSSLVTKTTTSSVDSLPGIACEVTLTATGHGDREKTAVWDRAVFRFFYGRERTEVTATDTVTGPDLLDLWDKVTVAGGETVTSPMIFFGGFPFTVEADFHFKLPASTRKDKSGVAHTRFDCGPVAGTAITPAPPVISDVSFPPLVYEPSDTIRVTYTLRGNGLWASGAALSSPCDLLRLTSERLATAITRTLVMPIPKTCAPGTQLGIAVLAINSFTEDTAVFMLGPQVVDTTRPRIQGGFAGKDGLVGEFWTGDEMVINVGGFDNYQVDHVYWWIPAVGLRDSIPVKKLSGGGAARIPISQSWPYAVDIKLWARDFVGNTSDTLRSSPGQVTIVRGRIVPLVTGSMPGRGFEDIVLDSRRGVLYALDRNGGRIIRYSIAEAKTTGQVNLPSRVSNFDLTPSGDSLVASLNTESALAIINLVNPAMPFTKLPITVPAATGNVPLNLRVSAANRVFVTMQTNPFSVAEISLSTGSQQIRADAVVGGVPPAPLVGRSDDGGTLIFNGNGSMLRYRSGTNVFGPTGSGRGVIAVFDATGTTIATGGSIYDENLVLQRTLLFSTPRVALTPDGEYMYMHEGAGVYRLRVSTGEIVDQIKQPHGVGLMAMAANGTYLVLVGNSDPTLVTVADLR